MPRAVTHGVAHARGKKRVANITVSHSSSVQGSPLQMHVAATTRRGGPLNSKAGCCSRKITPENAHRPFTDSPWHVRKSNSRQVVGRHGERCDPHTHQWSHSGILAHKKKNMKQILIKDHRARWWWHQSPYRNKFALRPSVPERARSAAALIGWLCSSCTAPSHPLRSARAAA